MSKIIFPDSKKGWTGTYRGDVYGSFWSSFSVDIDNVRGFISPSDRLYRIMDDTTDSDFDVPVAFIRSSAGGTDRYWCVVTPIGPLFKSINSDATSWQQDSDSNSPTAAKEDIIDYGGDLFVFTSGGTDNIYRLSGTWTPNWWSGVGGATLTFGDIHRFDTFLDLLLVGSGQYVHTWDGSVVSNNRLTLPINFSVYDMAHTSDYALIMGKSSGNEESRVFFWDGTSTTYNNSYDVGPNGVGKLVVVGNIPYIVSGNGISRFSGAGFVPIFSLEPFGGEVTGVTPYENGFLIMVRGAFNITAGYDTRMSDGIYYYNTETGVLSHRYSISQYDGATNVDYGQRYIPGISGAVYYNDGHLFVGSYYDHSGVTKKGLFTLKTVNNTESKIGVIITPKIMSGAGFGFYRDVIAKFLKFRNTGDKITIKYRTEIGDIYKAYVTWIDNNSFSHSAKYSGAIDAEIIDGDNSGLSAQIVSISDSSPYVYTLDGSLPSATPSGSSFVVFSNWKKLGSITDNESEAKLLAILKRAEWIQFKIELWRDGKYKTPSLTSLILDTKESLR